MSIYKFVIFLVYFVSLDIHDMHRPELRCNGVISTSCRHALMQYSYFDICKDEYMNACIQDKPENSKYVYRHIFLKSLRPCKINSLVLRPIFVRNYEDGR